MTLTITYTTVQHPTTGETYAVEIRRGETYSEPNAEFWLAAGPLHYSESTDEHALSNWIANADPDDAAADGAWLYQACEAAGTLPPI